MIDDSLTFQKHIKRWTRISQICSKQGDDCMSYLSQGMMNIPTIALEKYKNIAQNEPQNTSKWLPEEQLNGYNFIT